MSPARLGPDDLLRPDLSGYDASIGRLTADVASRLVEHAGVRLGDRVLDVGCGTGCASLAAAAVADPTGEVTAVDRSAQALTVGREKARTLGLTVDFREEDAMLLPFEPGRFDVVLCGFVLMFMPSVGETLLQLHDLLRMHGRVGIACWCTPPAGSLWDLVAQPVEAGMTERDRRASRQPFSLGDEEVLEDYLRGAGFADLAMQRVVARTRFESPEEVWQSLIVTTGRGQQVARSGGEEALARARTGALRRLRAAGGWPLDAELTAILAQGVRRV